MSAISGGLARVRLPMVHAFARLFIYAIDHT